MSRWLALGQGRELRFQSGHSAAQLGSFFGQLDNETIVRKKK
jgi:hypothetical protein